MKKILFLLLIILAVSGCGNKKNRGDLIKVQTFTINEVTFEMILIEGGTFIMEMPTLQNECNDEETVCSYQITLDNYAIGKTEVTQALWMALMDSNPSYYKGDDLPVETVSWNDCQEFIQKLNQITGKNFRLPTEAEWEFAACGGTKSKGYKYAGSNCIYKVAWNFNNSLYQTHSVATKHSNELGIYDMSGNVSEWCQNNYLDLSKSQTNLNIVKRGGDYGSSRNEYCVAYRSNYFSPDDKSSNIGFRLCLSE